MEKYRLLLPYALRQWPSLVTIFVLTLLGSLATALQPWPLKVLVDFAIGDSSLPANLRAAATTIGLRVTPGTLVASAAVASLFLFALNSALDAGLTLSWARAGQRMVREIAYHLFDR